MLPAHVDCWAQTAPAPVPTPNVAVFLHGPERDMADVQVCWRADLDLTSDDATAASVDVLAICPPAAAECLPVPIRVFRQWMRGQAVADDNADVASMPGENRTRGDEEAETRRVVRWSGRRDVECIAEPGAVRPGDVVVIAAHTPGWEELGDLPSEEGATPTLDWGDRAHRQIRAKAFLRLNPKVLDQWPECAAKTRLSELAVGAHARYEEDAESLVADLRETMRTLAGDESVPTWLREVASALAQDRRLRRGVTVHPLGGLIARGSRPLPALSEAPDHFSDEDDASASGTVAVALSRHLPGVAAYARRFAAGCGLGPELVATLERAGLLHDLGKADPRFQALLRGGSPFPGSEPLAKSGDVPQGLAAFQRAREAAGYPQGARHELLSVRLAESAPPLLPPDDSLKDLVLHLVASHHGRCRPFAPVVFDNNPAEVTAELNGHTLAHSSDTRLERLDSGVADRFWRLVRRYGWWGLAWLEAILRLADHRRSEAEALQVEETPDESD